MITTMEAQPHAAGTVQHLIWRGAAVQSWVTDCVRVVHSYSGAVRFHVRAGKGKSVVVACQSVCTYRSTAAVELFVQYFSGESRGFFNAFRSSSTCKDEYAGACIRVSFLGSQSIGNHPHWPIRALYHRYLKVLVLVHLRTAAHGGCRTYSRVTPPILLCLIIPRTSSDMH